MPNTQIDVRRGYTEEEERSIIDAVQGALESAFRIPAHDRNVRLVVHEPHRFACPPGKSNPDRYTHVGIDAFEGRSLEAKRALYRHIVVNLEALGIPRDHVQIRLRELPRSNWGIRGGQAGCDVELGFEVNV
jgi:phenylpyruvate tautomerase PptA (4-oxalocrotonate tautomerase family)